MAEVRQLKKTISELDTKIENQDSEKEMLTQNILRLEERGNEQRAEITHLKNENDDLKYKGGELSPVHFDKLNS